MRNKIISLALILCILLSFTACQDISLDFIKDKLSPKKEAAAGNTGVKAPDFTVYDTLGSEIRFSSFTDKPSILYLWRTERDLCKDEMIVLEKYYKQYGDEINFMLINLTNTNNESQKDAVEYVKGFHFPVYYDLETQCKTAYNAVGFPKTILINRNGYIYNDFGDDYVDEEFLDKHIPRLLNDESYVPEETDFISIKPGRGRCGC